MTSARPLWGICRPCTGIVLALAYVTAANAQRLPEQASDAITAATDPFEIEAAALDYFFGHGVAVDYAEAARLFELSAAAGLGNSQYMLGQLNLGSPGTERDADRAYELFELAAHQGVTRAQTYLGMAYLNGEVIEPDLEEARLWLGMAARQGDASALGILSTTFGDSRESFEADQPVVMALTTRAAELGNVPALSLAGGLLARFGESDTDRQKGIEFLKKSYVSGNAQAAFLLGSLYLMGLNVPRDLDAAREWMTYAVASDIPGAHLQMADFYLAGKGGPANPSLSQREMDRAFESNSPLDINNFAWTLSAYPDAVVRNGELAVLLMERLLADPNMRHATYLDTLAAAYAEAGQFDLAVAAQQEAIDQLVEDGSNEQTIASITSRLELYTSHEAYRLPQ